MNVDAVVPEVAIGRSLDGKVTMIIVDRVGAHTATTMLTFTPEGARWAASELSRAAGVDPRPDSAPNGGNE